MGKSFFKFLDTVGDGSGSKSGVVDGSSTPVILRLNGTHTDLYINRMLVHIRCARVGFSADNYGDIENLTPGVQVSIFDKETGLTIQDLCDGMCPKNNAEWGQLCYDQDPVDYGNGDRFVNVRWTFAKAGKPLVIKENQYIGVVLAANFGGLIAHTYMVNGYTKN